MPRRVPAAAAAVKPLAVGRRGARRDSEGPSAFALGAFISPITQLHRRGRRRQRMSQPRAQPRPAPAELLRDLPSDTGRHPRSRARVGRDRRAANPHGKMLFVARSDFFASLDTFRYFCKISVRNYTLPNRPHPVEIQNIARNSV